MLKKINWAKLNNVVVKKFISLFVAIMLLMTSAFLNCSVAAETSVKYPDKMLRIASEHTGDAVSFRQQTLIQGHTYKIKMLQNGITGVRAFSTSPDWSRSSNVAATVGNDGEYTTYTFNCVYPRTRLLFSTLSVGTYGYMADIKLYDITSNTEVNVDFTTMSFTYNNDLYSNWLVDRDDSISFSLDILNSDVANISFIELLDFDKSVFENEISTPTSKDKMLHLVSRAWGEHGVFLNATAMRNKTYRLTYYFNGEGGNGDYGVRLVYYMNNWQVKKSISFSKSDVNEENGQYIQEFTVPIEAENLQLFINEGSAADVNLWVHDVNLIDITDPLNPSENLQSDWLTKWSGNPNAELVDIDMSKFEPKNYENKMLHLKTSSWGEYGTSFLGAADFKGKTFRLTYYFKGEGGNGDYSMRVWYWYNNWSNNKSVTFTKNEVDSKTGMYTQEFTVPDDAVAIKIYINEGYAADADIWVSDVSLVDVANPDKELQGDWLEKWSGQGTAEIIDKDLSIFAAKETANKMLHLKTKQWGEYGTAFLNANDFKGKTFRITYYFKGEGGAGDYNLRVWYWYDNWSKNKSVTYTKNEKDIKTGMYTQEFTVPDEAENIKIYINEGSADNADIYVSDFSLVDVANPGKELQGDWLEKWSGQGEAELIDRDLEIFKPIDYSTKTLKITTTAEWAEYRGSYELTIGKSYEFSYYFRYESIAADDIPSMRVMSGSTILKSMLIEDDNYNKFTLRFTVPENSAPLANDPTKTKITFCLNEAMNIGNQMWLHIISLVDVQDSDQTDLAEDKFQRWSGSGDKELSEFNKEEFLKKDNSSKAQYMLIISNNSSGVEYGTSATVKPNVNYRLNMYYSDKAESAVKVYYKNQSDEFKSVNTSVSQVENLFFIYNFDFTVPLDAKTDKDGNTEVYVRLVSNTDKTVYCYMPLLTRKGDTDGENLIRDPGLVHNFNKWNSYKIGTEEIVREMYNFNYSVFDSGKFVSPSAKTMIKAEAVYRMATFGVASQLEIGKTYEFSMYCCGVKTSEFHIYYYDNNYMWKALLTDSETYSETELFKTYVFTVPDDALKSNGTNKTTVHLRFSAGAQGSVNYLYKPTLVDINNKNQNLINDPSATHSFDGWYIINYESPGSSTGGAVRGLSLVALDMNTFVDDTSDRPYNDGEWVKKFGIKPYLLGIDESDSNDSMFDDTYLDEEPLNNEELKQDEQTDGGESKQNVVTTVIKKRKKVFLPEEDYTWIYISCAAGAVLIAGGVTAFVIIKKKKNKVL